MTLILEKGALHDRRHSGLIRFDRAGHAVAVADLGLIVLSAVASWAVAIAVLDFRFFEVGTAIGLALVFALTFVSVSAAQGAYDTDPILTGSMRFKRLAATWCLTLIMFVFAGFLVKLGAGFPRSAAVIFGGLGLGVVALNRVVWRRLLLRASDYGLIGAKRVGLIVNGSSYSRDLPEKLSRGGYYVVRVVEMAEGNNPGRTSARRTAERVEQEFRGLNLDEIVVSISWRRLPFAIKLSDRLRSLPLPVRLIVDPVTSEIAARPLKPVSGMLMVEMHPAPMNAQERFAKRALDITVALAALIVASPLLLLVAAAIKIESRGPALFLQTRYGFNRIPFRIIKFRSMTVLEDGDTVRQASRGDVRVTRVGRFIRSTSIDELPQLWNVLRGEMSLVGPRPHAVAHDEHYQQIVGDYAFRQHVKPGLTGWAQVNGHRGETPTVESMAARVEHDVWYVNNRSFALDLKILFMTLRAVMDVRRVY